MKHRKTRFDTFVPNARIYYVIIALMTALLAWFHQLAALVGVFFLVCLPVYSLWMRRRKQRDWNLYVEGLSADIDEATRNAIMSMPIPLVIVDVGGVILWCNEPFTSISNNNQLLERRIDDIVPGFSLRELMESEAHVMRQVLFEEKVFRVFLHALGHLDSTDKEQRILLYWFDETPFENLKQHHNQERPVLALVQIDNYDEVMRNTEEDNRSGVYNAIEQLLRRWVTDLEGVFRKYEKDKYLVFFPYLHLESQEKDRFSILDAVREIQEGNRIPVTLSIGIGTMGRSMPESMTYAATAKDLCLGRGGDQVAVKRKEDIKFYGGKSQAIQKSTRVKARVVAYGLRQLMDEADNVLVMGHKQPDLDALGAALGIFRAARNRMKDVWIVLDKSNPSIDVLVERMNKDEAYQDIFLRCEEAVRIQSRSKSLVVVVDTHRPGHVECTALLAGTDRVVVIDHHRKSTDFIDPAILVYHEVSASSASEMVTELVHHMEPKSYLTVLEAEALMAGIALDTKNFTFKTGVRTFEAASSLRRAGADTTMVRRLFQDELDTIVSRADVIKQTEILYGQIALAVSGDHSRNAQLVAAQAADVMLTIRGVDASFVMGTSSAGQVFISGRSLGEVNVQVVLEKLGGGGHMTVAGAQLEGTNIEEVRNRLIQAIEQVLLPNVHAKMD